MSDLLAILCLVSFSGGVVLGNGIIKRNWLLCALGSVLIVGATATSAVTGA